MNPSTHACGMFCLEQCGMFCLEQIGGFHTTRRQTKHSGTLSGLRQHRKNRSDLEQTCGIQLEINIHPALLSRPSRRRREKARTIMMRSIVRGLLSPVKIRLTKVKRGKHVSRVVEMNTLGLSLVLHHLEADARRRAAKHVAQRSAQTLGPST